MKYINTIRSLISRIDAPVLVQEMRVRLRGWRPFLAMSFSVIILSGITLLFIYGRSSNPSQVTDQVREAFMALILVQLGLVTLTTPALSASSISGEREKGTLELLALTTLSSSAIAGQKFLVVVLQSALLGLVSVPVVAVVFLVGGVSPMELIIAYALLFFTGVLMSALGLFCSCIWRSSRASTAVAYIAAVIYLAAAPLAVSWLGSVASVGMSAYVEASPYLFIIMFAFTGGLFALIAYSILAAILYGRAAWWRTRANRMAVFGAAYAGLLLVLSLDNISGPAAQSFLGFNVLTLVNPFMALVYMMNSTYYPRSYESLAWITTIIFSAGVGYFLTHMSGVRFSALRRA